jgi:hypothetical protein
VVEIGPGPGGLTRALLGSDAASVTVVELDQRAVAAMEELAGAAGGRLHVVAGDVLALDVPALVSAPRQVVANLPYNIATPLLIGWLRRARAFERLTLIDRRSPNGFARARRWRMDDCPSRSGPAARNCCEPPAPMPPQKCSRQSCLMRMRAARAGVVSWSG